MRDFRWAGQGEVGNCPFGYIFSLCSSELGSSTSNRGSDLLQSKKVIVAAKWHTTHFLLLKNFQEIGFCSTKVTNSTVFLSEGSKRTQVEGGLQPQLSRVLVQRSMSRQNWERITILTPQKHFYRGPWNCGIKWQGKDTGWQHTPRTIKCASFMIAASYWNLNRLQRSVSTFKTTKYIALGYTNTIIHTHNFLL